MNFLQEIGIFLAETFIFVTAILVLVSGLFALSQRRRTSEDGYIEVRSLNDRYTDFKNTVRSFTEYPDERKAREKMEKKAAKNKIKQAKAQTSNEKSKTRKPRLFVLHFNGDTGASQTEALREEVSTVLSEVSKDDEILVCLESPGGIVHGYGLAASQLRRIRDAQITLTVAVDKVAASGGYMMACIADQILAAPFAVIGSIGVLAQLPNFHRLLKKNNIDFELITAGKHKRTLTLFGENTNANRQKFTEELEEVYGLFKDFVKTNRDIVDIESVATGEVWYGQQALDKKLIDKICTSDDYIQAHLENSDVLEVRYIAKKSWQEKFGSAIESMFERSAMKIWQRGTTHQLP